MAFVTAFCASRSLLEISTNEFFANSIGVFTAVGQSIDLAGAT